MSEARIDSLSNESNTGGPTLSGITTFSGTNYFVPPSGSIAERPDSAEKGSLRYNTDRGVLEYYRGDGIGWWELQATSEEMGASSAAGGGHLGFGMGGYPNSGQSSKIDYHNISTSGTWQTFGSLFSGRYGCTATSSRLRAVIFSGYGSNNDTIDYLNLYTKGDSVDTINLASHHKYGGSFSNGVRGCVAGSYNPQNNVIEYVDIATLGKANDFGDLTVAKGIMRASSNTTRGIIGGGYPSTLTIDYVTITSTGNAADFGDLISSTGQGGGNAANAIRSVWGGQYNDIIGYITIATKGDALDFGNNNNTHGHRPAVASPTRAMWLGGKLNSSPYPAQTDVDSIEIMSTGNGVDWGDIAEARSQGAATSNGHGGIS